MTHTSRLHEWNYFACRAADYADDVGEWIEFANIVTKHIRDYTIPQYGDLPDDLASTWTQDDCLRSIDKYIKRKGKNIRKQQDGLDCIKRAHYACIAYFKEGDADKDELINHALKACRDYNE